MKRLWKSVAAVFILIALALGGISAVPVCADGSDAAFGTGAAAETADIDEELAETLGKLSSMLVGAVICMGLLVLLAAVGGVVLMINRKKAKKAGK